MYDTTYCTMRVLVILVMRDLKGNDSRDIVIVLYVYSSIHHIVWTIIHSLPGCVYDQKFSR